MESNGEGGCRNKGLLELSKECRGRRCWCWDAGDLPWILVMVDDIVVVRACNVGGGRTHSAPGFGKGICGKSLHVEHLFMAAQWTITLVRGWSVGQVVLTRRCIPKEKTDASKERCGRCRGLQASRTCALSELESELLCALAEVTELCHKKKGEIPLEASVTDW